MLSKNEKKTLCCFAIFLATFATMVESQEGREEFLRELEGIKLKVLDDMSKMVIKGT